MSTEAVVHLHAHEHQNLTVGEREPAAGATGLLKALARDSELRAQLVTDDALRARMSETMRTAPDAHQQLEQWIERDRAETDAMLRAVRNEVGALIERYPLLPRTLKRAAIRNLCGRVALVTSAVAIMAGLMVAIDPILGVLCGGVFLMFWSTASAHPPLGPASPFDFAHDIRARRLAWRADDETFVREFLNVAGADRAAERRRTVALVEQLTDAKAAQRYLQLTESADIALERIEKADQQLAPWRLYKELEAASASIHEKSARDGQHEYQRLTATRPDDQYRADCERA